MIQEFNDLPWHDAELEEIYTNRTQNDNIRLLIRWPPDYGSNLVCIEFFNCYAFQAEMNFGMSHPDPILDAECIIQSDALEILKKKWGKMGIDLSGIYCFWINTNTTNSTINIYAKSFKITNVE